MTWTLREDWLSVVGLFLLTAGTGAQALAYWQGYRNLRDNVPADTYDAFSEALKRLAHSPPRLSVNPQFAPGHGRMPGSGDQIVGGMCRTSDLTKPLGKLCDSL
jgi:hypothetical protein